MNLSAQPHQQFHHGIEPTNLIGTKSKDGLANVTIFSSVVHLGSNQH